MMANENDSEGWQVVAGASKVRAPPVVKRDRARGMRRSVHKALEGERGERSHRDKKIADDQRESPLHNETQADRRVEKKLVPAAPPPADANPWKKMTISHSRVESTTSVGTRTGKNSGKSRTLCEQLK